MVQNDPRRLPEATLLMLPLSHCGSGGDGDGDGDSVGAGWKLSKLGSWVDAADVVTAGGAAHLHAVGEGGAKRTCKGKGGKDKVVHVAAMDSALLSVGER